jgi:hypothetical protein
VKTMICDTCQKKYTKMVGYLLITKEVIGSKKYWEATLKDYDPFIDTPATDPDFLDPDAIVVKAIQKKVLELGLSKTRWWICDNCWQKYFSGDPVIANWAVPQIYAQKYAETGEYNILLEESIFNNPVNEFMIAEATEMALRAFQDVNSIQLSTRFNRFTYAYKLKETGLFEDPGTT